MSLHPIHKEKELSFFKDKLVFSKKEKNQSIKIRVLAVLESCFHPIGCQTRNFEVQTPDDTYPSEKILILQKPSSIELSFSKKILLKTIEIIATLLILPRLIGEFIRFFLRKSLNIKLMIEETSNHHLEEHFPDITEGSFQIRSHFYNTDEVRNDLATISAKILELRNIQGVTYLSKTSSSISFILEKYPNLVFKTPLSTISDAFSIYPNILLKKTLKKQTDLKNTISTLGLTNVIVPEATVMEITDSKNLHYYFLIEEKLTLIRPDQQWKLEDYQELKKRPLLIDLARLITFSQLKFTNFSDYPFVLGIDGTTKIGILGYNHTRFTSIKIPTLFDLSKLFKELTDVECMKAIKTAVVKDRMKIDPSSAKDFDTQLEALIPLAASKNSLIF